MTFTMRFSMLMSIPEPLLLLLLSATTTFAQTSLLAINTSTPLNSAQLSSSAFSIAGSSTERLTVSVALCGAAPSGGNAARFFATNDTSVNNPGPDNIGSNVLEIFIGSDGIGNVTFENAGGGGWFAVDAGSAQQAFDVGISDTIGILISISKTMQFAYTICVHTEPLHELTDSLPLLGDTTSNQALLFSPPVSSIPVNEPSYPNYTFPEANLTTPDLPSIFPNFTLFLGQTDALPSFDLSTNSFSDGTSATACSLQNLQGLSLQNGSAVRETPVLRGSTGWRTQWLVNELQPLTNYTAFVIENGVKVSGPIFFLTKSGI